MTTHVGKWLRFFGNKCSIAEVILLFQWLGAVSKRILDERYQNWIDDSFNPNWIQLFWKAIIWREALFHLSKFCDSSLSWVNVLRFLGRPSWNQTSCLFFFFGFHQNKTLCKRQFLLGTTMIKMRPHFLACYNTSHQSGIRGGAGWKYLSSGWESFSFFRVFVWTCVTANTLFWEQMRLLQMEKGEKYGLVYKNVVLCITADWVEIGGFGVPGRGCVNWVIDGRWNHQSNNQF